MANGNTGQAKPPGSGGPERTYSDEFMLSIVKRHHRGENLLAILREPGMPDWGTFYDRTASDLAPEELSRAYTRARAAWSEIKIAETTEIADDSSKDDAPRDGLRIKSRQWFAERIVPKLYAMRQQLTHQNPDGSSIDMRPIVEVTVLPQPKE